MSEESSGKDMCLCISNTRVNELILYLEPWGEHYTMAPGATFQILARGPEGDCLEVEYGDNYITLYGWPGSVLSIFQDGIELGVGSFGRTPVPPLPNHKK